MNEALLMSLLTAHVAGDFYCQNDKMCENKRRHNIMGMDLYLHSIIIGAVSWLALFRTDAWCLILILTLSHFLLDAVKSFLERRYEKELIFFIADQMLHVGVIAALSWYYGGMSDLPISYLPEKYPFIILALLICAKPANILIRLTLKSYKVEMPNDDKGGDIKNAGGLIGSLERILTIIFMSLNQYEAIGFIIAAKSILRFKDTETAKTEYVLTGTLLSFGIAIVCGLMII